MIQILEGLFGNPAYTVVYDLLYVLTCNACLCILLLRINCMDARLVRVAGFSAAMTLLVAIPSYSAMGAWALYVKQTGAGLMLLYMRGLVIALFSYRNPLWLAVYFIAARKILGLSKRSVASSSLLVFFFAELFALISDGAEYLYLPFRDILSPYAGFAIAELALSLALAIACVFALRHIDRNIHRLKMLFEVGSMHQSRMGIRSFWAACGLWSLLALGQLFVPPTPSSAKPYFLFIMAVGIGTLIVMIIRNKLTHVALRQEQLRYNILYDMSEELRGWKHDTNNILQIYEGFIRIEDLPGLKAFHAGLFKNSTSLSDELNYSAQLQDCPALYGLFLSMNSLALKSGVQLDISNLHLFKQIDIPDLDLCRLLANLIKNAIEAASLAIGGSAWVSINRSGDQSLVISIANSTAEPVNTAHMFQKGYTSKQGHMGRGLSEVNNILAKYYGCTITPSYEDHTLTMYVCLPREKCQAKVGHRMSEKPGLQETLPPSAS